MATRTELDTQKMEAFVGKVLGDTSATLTTILACMGDRLGLFKDLDARGPATSEELAARTGIHERYAREWLGGMMTAGYLEYEPASRRFRLPPEHAGALAEESGPFFFGGVYEMIPPLCGVMDALETAFRKGGGVPQSAYHASFWMGMERFTASWFENHLLQEWIPAMPDVQAKLERGVRVADVGCGRGRALVKLGQAFPRSRFVGYDAFAPSIARATELARQAQLGDRVTFEPFDAAKPLPEKFDVIFTFDVLHDAVDPAGILRSIRNALQPGGIYVCLDINCSDKLEENAGPLGAMFHGFSVLYCMTTSLAGGGAALGTLGLHERKLSELAAVAGYESVRRVPLENPFNNLYEVRP